MRNVEHLVRDAEPDVDADRIEEIRRDLETNKIMILMGCANRDQVSLRIRQEIRKRLTGEVSEPTEDRKAA